MAYGVDYAFYSHPSIAALKAARVKFVCRYVSPFLVNDQSGKNLLPAEAAELLAAGFLIVVVFESYAERMLDGHSAGRADAQHADAVVTALGMPGTPVYFACDFDAREAQQPAIDAYLDGAASVVGRARVGLYGGYWPLARARAAGKATYYWGTFAWSGDRWDLTRNPGGFVPHIMQGLQIRLGGASCDPNESYGADFAQWPRPAVAPPVPEEDDAMPELKTGPAAETVVAFAGGQYNWVAFLNDATLGARPAPRLRVAVHPADGSPWHVSHLTLTPSGKDTYRFPVTANGFTVIRDNGETDTGDTVPVAYNLGT